MLRVNPDVDAGTHAKISTGKAENKFGVPIDQAPAMFARLARARRACDLRGVAIHIGSQLADLAPLEAAYRADRRAGRRAARARATRSRRVDLGGGLGVPYQRGRRAADARRLWRDGRARDRAAGTSS